MNFGDGKFGWGISSNILRETQLKCVLPIQPNINQNKIKHKKARERPVNRKMNQMKLLIWSELLILGSGWFSLSSSPRPTSSLAMVLKSLRSACWCRKQCCGSSSKWSLMMWIVVEVREEGQRTWIIYYSKSEKMKSFGRRRDIRKVSTE